MIRRLKIKFVCINMLIVTVMLAVIFALVLHVTSQNMEKQGERIIQSIHEDPLQRGGHTLREKWVPFFTVEVSPNGTLSISSHANFDQSIDTELLAIAREVYEGGDKQGVLREHDLRFMRKKLPMGEEIIFVDVSVEHRLFRDLLETCIQISIISFFLFLVISVLLAQWAIRPVELAWKNQRQFVADASHELKTPLTVIMTNAELLQDSNYEIGEKEQFALSILTMSRQMRGLVEGLLDLSRVDNGVVKTSFSEIDFSELVCNSLLPFEPLFFEKNMELKSEVEPDIRLCGSQTHLRQVVEILLDNAVKYGCPEKAAEVRLLHQGRYAQLSVCTAGDEISRSDLKNIFRRFYRIDKARAMNQSYGLGLSIAESIVKDHRGKIWAESKNGMNSFFVLLPVKTGHTLSEK